MTQDEISRMARELVTKHGTRLCDEDGETHGYELYCVGIDDIAEIIKQVAAHEREQCAKLFEEESANMMTKQECAAAIRARGSDGS